VELIIEKFEAPHLLDFTSETDPARRLDRLLDVIFSKEWSKSVDIRVFFAFYYLSFREPVIRERFEAMFRRFRDHLAAEFELAHEHGLIQTDDRTAAADAVVTLMEGMEFHAAFLAEGRPFEAFAALAKGMAWDVLLGRVATASGPPGGSGMSISQAN
jgi:hypothetical protein